MRSFRSDNNAGLVPEALAAINEANEGHAIAYGDDAVTQRAVGAFRELFGSESAVYFVATGTAANTLAIAAMTEPWQRIVCHHHSHLNDDESTAPERLTQCRMTAVLTESSRLGPADIERIAESGRGDVHEPHPGVVSLSNATEFGTVYRPDDLKAICSVAHNAGYRVHVDGARFANAVASVNCDPAALAGQAGVDALCFGGTKNGLASGEVVLLFPQGDGSAYERAIRTFEHHRKSTGHLLSKHRFVAAPFHAVLIDGSWLRHARHANQQAQRLGEGLQRLGVELRFPVEANGVFAALGQALHEALQSRGYQYYPFGEKSWGVYRLMCSFDTTDEDVDALLGDVAEALDR